MVGVGAIQTLAQPFLYYSAGYGAGGLGVFSFLFGAVLLLGSAAALVLGLIAMRRDGGKLLAGIAIGVGAVQVLGIVLGWMSTLFYNFI